MDLKLTWDEEVGGDVVGFWALWGVLGVVGEGVNVLWKLRNGIFEVLEIGIWTYLLLCELVDLYGLCFQSWDLL